MQNKIFSLKVENKESCKKVQKLFSIRRMSKVKQDEKHNNPPFLVVDLKTT
jgi:hypothetical protein